MKIILATIILVVAYMIVLASKPINLSPIPKVLTPTPKPQITETPEIRMGGVPMKKLNGINMY